MPGQCAKTAVSMGIISLAILDGMPTNWIDCFAVKALAPLGLAVGRCPGG